MHKNVRAYEKSPSPYELFNFDFFPKKKSILYRIYFGGECIIKVFKSVFLVLRVP